MSDLDASCKIVILEWATRVWGREKSFDLSYDGPRRIIRVTNGESGERRKRAQDYKREENLDE